MADRGTQTGVSEPTRLAAVGVLALSLLVVTAGGRLIGSSAEATTSPGAGSDTDPLSQATAASNPAMAVELADTALEQWPEATVEVPVPVPRERLVINGVGDVNVDPGYIPAFRTTGYEHALAGLDGLFLEDDLSVINLECPLTDIGAPVPKQFRFQCDPNALVPLREAGVEVANQGNNHVLDYGPDAMLDSIRRLRSGGIAPVGAGPDATAAHEPALFEINGWTVAVVGFGGVVPAASWIAADDRPGMADGDTIETMVAAVEAADEVADIVVVTIHWGAELQSGPPADDVARAEAMVAAGADAVFGHHAHRLNALEMVGGRPVAWSLGNFVWPRLSAAGSDTAVAQVIIEPDGRILACLIDVTIVSDGHPTLDDPAYRQCDPDDPRTLSGPGPDAP
ncbi:MAG: CapA family protein [Actinomycetota bacterium]